MVSMLASHRRGKKLVDVIFGASAACSEAVKIHGAEKVTNATLGAIMDEDGKFACIPTVEEMYRKIDIADAASYAPVLGLPAYLESAIDLTFGDSRPDGYVAACATPGGTGAIHCAIMNYSEIGDTVLTSDWFWGTYRMLCEEEGRTLSTYELFDADQNYNVAALNAKVEEILAKQDSLLTIINTPAHNPTGYSLSQDDWDAVLDMCKHWAKKGKKISLLVDIAYIDYAGDKAECRKFMEKFANLPENVFIMFAFSMSKGYTLYGQRAGAIIGFSSSKEAVDEFTDAVKYTSRSTWSNTNKGAQFLLVNVQQDKELLAKYEAERDALYTIIKERASIFTDEAKACGLKALPYKAGFFISVPSDDPVAVCDKLHDDLIYAVPLKKGVRIAVCSVPRRKMTGMAEKVLRALDAVGK